MGLNMSYGFDGSGDRIVGTLTTAVVFPCTIACFIKVTNHPYPTEKVPLMLANATGSTNDSAKLRTSTTVDNAWALRYTDSAGTTASPNKAVTADNTWLPWCATLASDDFTCYVSDNTGAGNSTTNVLDSAGMTKVHIGEDSSGLYDWLGNIAEVAIWDKVLSSAEVASYCSGTAASSIAAANLRGYWPLNASNATQSNLGLDSTGDLTVTNATYDADHPTITSGGHPAASRARGIPGMNTIASRFGRGW